jgi:hypothetical protein
VTIVDTSSFDPYIVSYTATPKSTSELEVSETVAVSVSDAKNVCSAEAASLNTAVSVTVAKNTDAATATLSVPVAESDKLEENPASALTISETVADSLMLALRTCPPPSERAANGVSAKADVPNTHQAASRLNV